MYFTREPIVETVITSKEGSKLVIRASKGSNREEYSVDAVEVVSFGSHCFFRSMEKSRSFLLPISDYEILEVRETKVVLKTPFVEKGIKIGGGREAALRPIVKEEKEEEAIASVKEQEPKESSVQIDLKGKKERRRFRKRKEDVLSEEGGEPHPAMRREEKISLIPPPTTLISETISRYKDLPDYAGAFFDREGKDPGVLGLLEDVISQRLDLDDEGQTQEAGCIAQEHLFEQEREEDHEAQEEENREE